MAGASKDKIDVSCFIIFFFICRLYINIIFSVVGRLYRPYLMRYLVYFLAYQKFFINSILKQIDVNICVFILFTYNHTFVHTYLFELNLSSEINELLLKSTKNKNNFYLQRL